MWKCHQKRLSWPNWTAVYFLKVSPTLSIPDWAEIVRIWHVAFRGEVLSPVSAGLPQTAPSPAGTAVAWDSCGSVLHTCWHWLQSGGVNPSQGAGLASLRGSFSAIPELGTPIPQSFPVGKFSPLTETAHQEPATKGHFSLQIWWCATLGSPHFQHQEADQKKKIYSELVSKLMTHLLWKARSCHFPQSSLDTQSKRTWEDLYPTSPPGKQEVFAEAVKS